jgi:hypothetical protein
MYVATVESLRQNERQDENQFTTKIEKLVWVTVISFCKICIPSCALMPYYAETDYFHHLIV